jgi:hypothetical protein
VPGATIASGIPFGCGARAPVRTPAVLVRSWSNVFDVFVVLGVIALFGVIGLIAKGVERL